MVEIVFSENVSLAEKEQLFPAAQELVDAIDPSYRIWLEHYDLEIYFKPIPEKKSGEVNEGYFNSRALRAKSLIKRAPEWQRDELRERVGDEAYGIVINTLALDRPFSAQVRALEEKLHIL